MDTNPQPTTSTTILAARARVDALKQELQSTAPAHGPGTDWRTSREAELALDVQRLARLEQFAAILP